MKRIGETRRDLNGLMTALWADEEVKGFLERKLREKVKTL